MKDSVLLSKMLRGYVRVENEDGMVVEASNLVVYNGGDIIAQLLGGNIEYRIAYMYFAYENTAGVPSPPAAVRGDTTAANYHALTAPEDFLRAPIFDPPTFEAADANHLFNRVTFAAVATDTVGVLGLPFGAANNSKVYGLGLVAAPTGAYAGDLLYANFILPSALPAAGSGQVSATWATEAD